MSSVPCHLSHVTCHVSHVTSFSFFYKVVKLVVVGSVINRAYQTLFQKRKVFHSIAGQQNAVILNSKQGLMFPCFRANHMIVVPGKLLPTLHSGRQYSAHCRAAL